NEAPVWKLQCQGSTAVVLCPLVEENSAVGTRVGDLPLQATDEDVGQTLTYGLTAGNTGSAFALDAATGFLSVARAVLDFEDPVTGGVYELTVSVTDNGSPVLGATGVVRVQLVDVNERPVMRAFTRSVKENSAVGTLVGATFGAHASDVDAGAWGQLTFSLTGGSAHGIVGLS
ncbi:MAG: cadherin repeat domain-containing protein, partial [Hydrogenophaga sp.]